MAYRMNEFLSTLVGQRMYAVEFALGDLVLKFDNSWGAEFPTLQCFALPTVSIGQHDYTSDERDWTYALRSLVANEVTATFESSGSGLRIELQSATITLRPTASEVRCPEIAMLRAGPGDWMVWRAGEEAFEYLG